MTHVATEKVVHVLRSPYDVYIGRANSRHHLPSSKWANPFKIGRDGTRDDVIKAYRKHIAARPDLLAALPELEGKTLACWCAPYPCHGDVLVDLIAKAESRDQ